jgi:hypothetical protein
MLSTRIYHICIYKINITNILILVEKCLNTYTNCHGNMKFKEILFILKWYYSNLFT